MAKSPKQNQPTEKQPIRRRVIDAVGSKLKKINEAYDPTPRIKKALAGQQEGYKKATDDRIKKQLKKSGG